MDFSLEHGLKNRILWLCVLVVETKLVLELLFCISRSYLEGYIVFTVNTHSQNVSAARSHQDRPR